MNRAGDCSNKMSEVLERISQIYEFINSLDYSSLNQSYQKRKDISEKLGANGWVISQNLTPANASEWLRKIESNGEEVILNEFSEQEIDAMIDKGVKKFCENPERLYFEKGVENYFSGRYTETAIFWICLLDYKITKITPKELRKKVKQCNEGLNKAGEQLFQKAQERTATKVLFLCDYLPSFSKFATRVFVDGEKYDFDKGVEPPYLNRNWLLHGKMTRRIKRYECIQILNAINTLCDMEADLQWQTENGVG